MNDQTKPELKYLILSRDVITDDISKEKSAIRIFDLVVIPKGVTRPYFYSFYCLGKVFLNTNGSVKSIIKATVYDPSGKEIRYSSTLESTFIAEYSITFSLLLFAIPFNQEGQYSVVVSVNINGGEFVHIGQPLYFQVNEIK